MTYTDFIIDYLVTEAHSLDSDKAMELWNGYAENHDNDGVYTTDEFDDFCDRTGLSSWDIATGVVNGSFSDYNSYFRYDGYFNTADEVSYLLEDENWENAIRYRLIDTHISDFCEDCDIDTNGIYTAVAEEIASETSLSTDEILPTLKTLVLDEITTTEIDELIDKYFNKTSLEDIEAIYKRYENYKNGSNLALVDLAVLLDEMGKLVGEYIKIRKSEE